MSAAHTITAFRGPDIQPWLDDVARLRVAVFRDWPYLYEGDLDYEREYLSAYAASPDSVFVLAQAGQEMVGASTGLPLLDDSEAFRQPFLHSAIDPAEVFYFGESVLLPHWRGKGIGHAFFDAREQHARALGRYRWTAFAAVDRGPDDARRPHDYRSNDVFWHKRGYTRQAGMTMRLEWNEIGRGEIAHPLTFWTRALDTATSEHSA
ncbi:MAG TPA: GNAT family N-acetyltransferase [Pseudoxanthomonas sp.]|nr:GNAT family N-acetyltransferase [Pseudoxanthomonas sp.]